MAGDAVPGRAPRPTQRGLMRGHCICIHCREGKRLLRVLEHPRCPAHGRGGEWRSVGTVGDPEPGDGNAPWAEGARRRDDS